MLTQRGRGRAASLHEEAARPRRVVRPSTCPTYRRPTPQSHRRCSLQSPTEPLSQRSPGATVTGPRFCCLVPERRLEAAAPAQGAAAGHTAPAEATCYPGSSRAPPDPCNCRAAPATPSEISVQVVGSRASSSESVSQGSLPDRARRLPDMAQGQAAALGGNWETAVRLHDAHVVSGPRTAVRSLAPSPSPKLRHVDGLAVVLAGGDERVDSRDVRNAALPVLENRVQPAEGERPAGLLQPGRPFPLEGRHPLCGTPRRSARSWWSSSAGAPGAGRIPRDGGHGRVARLSAGPFLLECPPVHGHASFHGTRRMAVDPVLGGSHRVEGDAVSASRVRTIPAHP